jgi:hypothetical protein
MKNIIVFVLAFMFSIQAYSYDDFTIDKKLLLKKDSISFYYVYNSRSKEACYIYNDYRSGGMSCDFSGKRKRKDAPLSVANMKKLTNISTSTNKLGVVRVEMGNGDVCIAYGDYRQGDLECKFRH